MKLAAAAQKSLTSYTELLKRVRETIAAGKKRALDAVEREGVRTKWIVGRHIQEHILLNQPRADYGARVIQRLSKDLQISPSELHRMVEFARENPNFGPGRQLSWAHEKMLLGINDPVKRNEIGGKAVIGQWSKRDLRREINKEKAARQITVSEAPAEEPLVSLKGKLDFYRVVTAKTGPWKGGTALDLGFANYHRPLAGRLPFSEKEIVLASKDGKLARAKNAAEADLFTYRAYVFDVTDADTLWMLVDLGFGFMTQQHLRLRGIDAPEITTREGQEAKRFVERELGAVIGAPAPMIITTTQSDKYDRYLADVFYTIKGEERFLNNRLLAAGLAGRTSL
jgi:endonuclease YncB( thermonuclease family)